MAKHVLTYAFIFVFTHFAAAQLTLQQVAGKKKHVISTGTLIALIFPIPTTGNPEKAFHMYQGQFKKVESTKIGLVLTKEIRYFVNDNRTTITETRAIHPPDTPSIVQMPLTQLKTVVEHLPKNKMVSNIGFTVFALAALSNIFIAPHLKNPQSKRVRNVGFVAIGLGLTTALLPSQRKYHLQQPKNGKKTLWRLIEP